MALAKNSARPTSSQVLAACGRVNVAVCFVERAASAKSSVTSVPAVVMTVCPRCSNDALRASCAASSSLTNSPYAAYPVGSVVAVAALTFGFALGLDEALALSLELLGDFCRLAFLAPNLARRAQTLIIVFIVAGRHL